MDEVLLNMIGKARTEAEEAQRQLLGAINGLAGVAWLRGEAAGAAASYRRALAISSSNRLEVCDVVTAAVQHCCCPVGACYVHGRGCGHPSIAPPPPPPVYVACMCPSNHCWYCPDLPHVRRCALTSCSGCTRCTTCGNSWLSWRNNQVAPGQNTGWRLTVTAREAAILLLYHMQQALDVSRTTWD
jgi:hypothetical protein